MSGQPLRQVIAVPEVTCTCGTTFSAARANAKYCSDRCRKRTKRSGAAVVPLPPAGGEVKAGPVEVATRRELEQADRVETFLGQLALATARKIDQGRTETGSAYSSLSKELRAVMLEAMRGAGKQSAPQALSDELAARRAGRSA